MEPITFWASVAKVQTLADGGLRFTLDVPEGALEAMAALAYAQANGIVLEVVCNERDPSRNDRDSTKLKF